MKPHEMEVMKEKCPTCPFRVGSRNEYLAGTIAESALNESSRICHSTGTNNAFHRRTGRPAALCRGARDLQLGVFAALGVIEAPTDAAWAKAWAELQLQPAGKAR